MKRVIASILGLFVFTSLLGEAHARIVFKNEYLIEEDGTEAFVIDSGDDVSGDLVLQFGASLAETITFDTADTEFEFSESAFINGNLEVDNGTTDTNIIIEKDDTTEGRLAFELAGVEVADISYNAAEELEFTNNTTDADIVFNIDDGGVDTEILLIDADVPQVRVQANPTLEAFVVTGDARVGGGTEGVQDFDSEYLTLSAQSDDWFLGVQNEAAAADSDFFIGLGTAEDGIFHIENDGDVGIGTVTPERRLNVSNTGANFGTAYSTIEVNTTGASAFGPSIELDATSVAGGEEYIIASTGDLDAASIGAGSLGIYDLTDNAFRFVIDTTGEVGLAGEVAPAHDLDIDATGEVIEIGDGTAADSIINFDDGADHNFGWDDSEGAISTFDEELRFRTRQSATPPVACSATVAGMQWMDTDNGITYSCDTSNSRDKWLSHAEMVAFGDESGSCPAGSDANSNANCNVDWGNGLGPDGATNLGFYIPNDVTVTGYGFSEDNDACTSGSFDLEIWGTSSNSDDNTYAFEADLATGLTGEAHNSNVLNVDIAGDQYTVWGIDNNCGQGIDDWNLVIYYRYRHD